MTILAGDNKFQIILSANKKRFLIKKQNPFPISVFE